MFQSEFLAKPKIIFSLPKDYHEVKGPYFFRNIVVQKQKAGVSVSAGVDASLSGEATEFQEFDLEYQIVTTPFLSWIELKKR